MKFTKAQAIDFSVLLLRWYLGYYMLDYGVAKLTGDQFGVHNPAVLDKPLREVDKFQLAWYLFSLDRTFDVGVGILQIASGLLLLFNRTLLVGALVVLPVLVQIFLVDAAFTTAAFGPVLALRLAGMIMADLLILCYYREKMLLVWQNLTDKTTTRFRYKWWIFLLMPVLGLLCDFAIGGLLYPVRVFIRWISH